MAPLILIVDDEISNRRTLSRVLQREGFSTIEAKDGKEALAQLHQSPTLMITDLKMPNIGGMELLTQAREAFPHTEVILMTAFGTIDLAVQAMREGAWDFIPKPIKRADLLRAVHKAIKKYDLTQENRELKKALAQALPKDWIGSSAQMDLLNVQALQAANSMASILLLGESGTGKSRLAQHIHQTCDPKDVNNPYVDSVTIVGGKDNIFNEDYHVVHHTKPMAHWTEYPDLYKDSIEEYRKYNATIFTDCEEGQMIYWLFSENWDEMAAHMVDLNGKMTHEEKKALCLERLRSRMEYK